MAVTKTRTARKGTKKAVIFAILDQSPGISTDDALKELKRRKIDLGEKPKQSFYSVRTLWNQERGVAKKSGPKRGGRRAAKQQPVEAGLEQEVELAMLQADNAKLKAVVAILLS